MSFTSSMGISERLSPLKKLNVIGICPWPPNSPFPWKETKRRWSKLDGVSPLSPWKTSRFLPGFRCCWCIWTSSSLAWMEMKLWFGALNHLQIDLNRHKRSVWILSINLCWFPWFATFGWSVLRHVGLLVGCMSTVAQRPCGSVCSAAAPLLVAFCH